MGIVLNWSVTAFPVGLDSVAGSFPTLTDTVHDIMASHPNSLASAVDAIEAKMGIDNSAVVTSFDFMLRQGRLTSQQPGGGVGSIAYILDTANAHSATDILLSLRSAGAERFRLGGGSATDVYLEMDGGSTAVPGALGTGRIRYNEATNKWQVSENGVAFADIGASGVTLQNAYNGGSSITTTVAGDKVALTRGDVLLGVGVSLLTLTDADVATGRTADLFSISDANVGTAIAARFQRSSVNGSALRAERTGAGDVVWESGLIAGSTITARIFGDGHAIFGGSAPIGAEKLRVTGGTTMLDFTSTTALTVAQTGGGVPALVVDTTNTRVGIGGAPGAFTLDVAGTCRVTGKLTVGGLIDPTGTVFDEQVAVPGGAPGAGKGTIWVRNDVPNVLVFTNDVGVDTVLGSGTADTMQTVYDAGPSIATDGTGTLIWTRGAGHGSGAGSQLLQLVDADGAPSLTNRSLALLDISDTNVSPIADPDVPTLRITRNTTSGQVAIHLAKTGTAAGAGSQVPSSKLQFSASAHDGAVEQVRTYSLLNTVTVGVAESATNTSSRLSLMLGTNQIADFYPRAASGSDLTLVISPRSAPGVTPALTIRTQGAFNTNNPILQIENNDNAANIIATLAVGATDLIVQDNTTTGYRLNLTLNKFLGAGAGAIDDELGSVYFRGLDSTLGGPLNYASVRGSVTDPVAGTLRGRLDLYAATAGSQDVLVAEVTGNTVGAALTRAGLVVRSRVTAASGAVPITLAAEANIGTSAAVLRVNDLDTTVLVEARGGGDLLALGSVGIGFVSGSPSARCDVDGDVAYRVISPAALAAGNNNNYAGAAGRSWARLTPDAGLGSTITGIAGGVNGRVLIIANVGVQTLVMTHNDNGVNSLLANQMLMGGGANVNLGVNDTIAFIYDSVDSAWRQIASVT